MADKQMSFEAMWTALMKVLGHTHRFKYQDGKSVITIINHRMRTR